jgi:hypothetical protein
MPAINTPFSKTVASFVRNLSQQKDMSCSSISRSISKHLVHAVFGKSAPYGGPHSLLLAGEGAMLKSTKRNGKSHLVAKYPIYIYTLSVFANLPNCKHIQTPPAFTCCDCHFAC